MSAKLTRLSPGEYVIDDGDKKLRILKGLGRVWTLETPDAVSEYPSYKRARTAAESVLRRRAPSPPTHETFASGPRSPGKGHSASAGELAAVLEAQADTLKALARSLVG